MRKSITAVLLATCIAVTVAAPKPAEARCVGCWVGAGVAAGLIGGALLADATSAYYGPYSGWPGTYGWASYYGFGFPPYAYAPGPVNYGVDTSPYYRSFYVPPAYYYPRLYRSYFGPRRFYAPHIYRRGYVRVRYARPYFVRRYR